MSQIKAALLITVISAAFALGGCGDPNSKAVFSPDSGGHAAGWSVNHKTAGTANTESCFGCHGENLDGGISKVSCTSCHIGNSGSVHPEQWGNYAYARHGAYVTAQKSPSNPNGTSRCANAACHGTDLSGVTGSGPSCTKCHIGGPLSKHPAAWGPINGNYNLLLHGQYADQNTLASCSTVVCHGTDLKGVFLSGPACSDCH